MLWDVVPVTISGSSVIRREDYHPVLLGVVGSSEYRIHHHANPGIALVHGCDILGNRRVEAVAVSCCVRGVDDYRHRVHLLVSKVSGELCCD